MAQHHCCSLIALAVCFAAAPAVAEEQTSAEQSGASPLSVLPAAPAEDGCLIAEAPCVRLWGGMTADERARLWPFLDEASKISYWRGMTHEERKSLRESLSERDREALRRRYSVDGKGAREIQRPKLCGEDRRLMREQIMEVHLQIMRRHGPPAGGSQEHGVQPLQPPAPPPPSRGTGAP